MRKCCFLPLILTIFLFVGCSDSDDDGDAAEVEQLGCGIDVQEFEALDNGNFKFRINNIDGNNNAISANIKYFKDGVVLDVIGRGITPQGLDANETVEFETMNLDINSTDDYDCAEYTLQVLTLGSGVACEVSSETQCN